MFDVWLSAALQALLESSACPVDSDAFDIIQNPQDKFTLWRCIGKLSDKIRRNLSVCKENTDLNKLKVHTVSHIPNIKIKNSEKANKDTNV